MRFSGDFLIEIAEASDTKPGLMSANDKKKLLSPIISRDDVCKIVDERIASLLVSIDTKLKNADPSKVPTAVQATSGTAPDSDRVQIIKGCLSVELLGGLSRRCVQSFFNASGSLVIIKSDDGIVEYDNGFGLCANESVSFVRDGFPAKKWRVW